MLFRLVHDQARSRAKAAIDAAQAGDIVRIDAPTRTLDQNALMWPLLDCLSRQIDWYGQKLTREEWKDVLTASLKKQKAVPGIDGGFVILGARTSRMPKKEFGDLIELIYAFGAEHGVDFAQ